MISAPAAWPSPNTIPSTISAPTTTPSRRASTVNMKPRKKNSSTNGASTQISTAQTISTPSESSSLMSVTSVWSSGWPKIADSTIAASQKMA